jgi:hypothetical protein
MDLKTAKRQKENGKPVKRHNRCWYVFSIDEEQKTVSMRDLPLGYRGTMITKSHVPISELSRAYQRRKAVDKQKA